MPGGSPGSSLGMAAVKCIISFKSAPQNNANKVKVAKQSPSKEGGGGELTKMAYTRRRRGIFFRF